MSVLDNIVSGKQHRPFYICVYAVPGVGKSTFASQAPSCLLWDIEQGATQIDCKKLHAPESWEAFKASLTELQQLDAAPFRSLAIDTIDALETLATEYVCRTGGKPTLAEFSWGAGYAALGNEWRIFLKGMERLRDRGINIILIAHEHRKQFTDPEVGAFDVYRPRLNERIWELTNQTMDAVLFAQYEHGIKEDSPGKKRAIISGNRILRTQRSTGFFAKNRYGLPETLPLEWSAFEAAARPASLDEMKQELSRMLENPKIEQEAKDKVVKFLADQGMTERNVRAIVNRLKELTA